MTKFTGLGIKNFIEENKELGFSPVIRTVDGLNLSEKDYFEWPHSSTLETRRAGVKDEFIHSKFRLEVNFVRATGLVQVKETLWRKNKRDEISETVLRIHYIPEENITSITFKKIPQVQEGRSS